MAATLPTLSPPGVIFFQRRKKTWRVEAPLPLAGIFFLEQSPSDHCLPLGPAEAAVAATASAQEVMTRLLLWVNPADARTIRQTMFANACELVKKIPAFRLKVSLTGRFWEQIEAALGGR